MTKRLDPANRQAALCAVALAAHRRAGHPLAGGRGHRWGGGLDPALGPPAQHLPPGHRSPGGAGHLDRGAPGQRRRPSGPAGRHRVDGAHARHRSIRAQRGRPGRPHQERHPARRRALHLRRRARAMPPSTRPSPRSSWPAGSAAPTSRASWPRAAANTRDQIALWQRTEVARAKPRRDMRLVIAVTLVFTARRAAHRPRLLQAVRHPGRPDRPAGRGRPLRRRLRGHEPAVASRTHAPSVRQSVWFAGGIQQAGFTGKHLGVQTRSPAGPGRTEVGGARWSSSSWWDSASVSVWPPWSGACSRRRSRSGPPSPACPEST